MTSFKLKLVLYFLILSLLPLLASFVGFTAVASRGETRLADARLQANLRASIAAYDQELRAAESAAARLARNRDFQEALADRDRRLLRRILSGWPNLRVESAGGFRIGRKPARAAERQVAVVGVPAGELGVVIASVPLDAGLVTRIRTRSGLERGEHVAVVRAGEIVAASNAALGRIDVAEGRTGNVTLAGEEYRVLSAATREGELDATLAVLTPQARIDAANRSTERRLLLGLVLSLLVVMGVAYVEGRAIVLTVRQLVHAARAIASGRLHERVPVRGRDELAVLGHTFNEMAGQLQSRLQELEQERARLREATARFGETLAATHDVDQLLRVVVETAVDATGATGGLLLGRKGELVQRGEPEAGEQRFELSLRAGTHDFGTLVLSAPSFTIQDVETAALLVGHAVVALDNARLHRIVERQALVDGLTGLANRRQAEDALELELSRAQRFGSPLAIVMADLDDFKAINDRHGHPAGDIVLRELADVLRENVREIDLAARWGGEEFVLLLPGTDATGAAKLAERVRAALEERTILSAEGVAMRVTASFGVAAYPLAATSAELIAGADVALYRAKRVGKNAISTATDVAPRS